MGSEPKFRPGDVVRTTKRCKTVFGEMVAVGEEFTVSQYITGSRAHRGIDEHNRDINFYDDDAELVYRPPSRAEVAALRKVAEAALAVISVTCDGVNGLVDTLEYDAMEEAVRDWEKVSQ